MIEKVFPHLYGYKLSNPLAPETTACYLTKNALIWGWNGDISTVELAHSPCVASFLLTPANLLSCPD